MSRVVALLTDFGPGSVYVGQLHAILAAEAPDVRVLDLAHDAPPGDVEAGAYLLGCTLARLPRDAVVVVVIDPGVGTARALLAARVGERLFVGPDNGVLAAAVEGGAVRRVDVSRLVPEPVSATFHGRDVLAPLAGRLARGLAIEDVGPPHEPRPAPPGAIVDGARLVGRVLVVDRFGNLVTNVPGSALGRFGGGVRITCGPLVLPGLDRTFGDVEPGMALGYVGSGGNLEIAINLGHAARQLGLQTGDRVVVEAGHA